MKGLQKITLALAIGAITANAYAEMKPLDDQAMSSMTGQAGITIEVEYQMDLGAFRWTDEGNLSINNLHVGGIGGTLVDDVQIDIDVMADGDAVIDMHSISGTPVDFNMTVGSIELNGLAGENTRLASNMNMEGLVSGVNLRIDTATDALIATVGVRVTDWDIDVDFLGIGLENMTVSSDNSAGSVTDANLQADIAAHGVFIVQGTLSKKANTRAASGEALAFDLRPLELDMQIGAVNIGGHSLGSIGITDLVVSNTHLEVYGH
ncbi:MAG: hypothetical protein H6999_03970 [Hahellaceae bacterium]|nr:hypothetical protein [Hahellaceae bacterium]MCP5168894.1 hypothetical protein [Hahellaceae bacterium]